MICFDINGKHFNPIWYAIIHVVIFAIFVIRVIAMIAGSEHIEKVGERAEQRHTELNKDKENYWK